MSKNKYVLIANGKILTAFGTLQEANDYIDTIKDVNINQAYITEIVMEFKKESVWVSST